MSAGRLLKIPLRVSRGVSSLTTTSAAHQPGSGLSTFQAPKSIVRDADPFALPPGLTQVPAPQVRYSASPKFSSLIIDKRDPLAAWQVLEDLINRDPDVLHRIDRRHLTAFFHALPRLPTTAKRYWPMACALKDALRSRDIELTSMEYVFLLKLALRSRNYEAIEPLWAEVPEEFKSADVELWNAYIPAACVAYPLFWPWPNRHGVSHLQRTLRLNKGEQPPLLQSVLNVLQHMELHGVSPNARTYELTILALAREGHLDTCEQMIHQLWLDNTRPLSNMSLLWPNSTLFAAIVDAFAFNERLTGALRYISLLQDRYKLDLNGAEGEAMWARLLWRVQTTKAPEKIFYEVWTSVARNYPVVPAGLWWPRIKFHNWKMKYDSLAEDAEKIWESRVNGHSELCHSAVKKAVRGLAYTSRAIDAWELLDKWAKRGIDLRPQLEDYVRRRGGGVTREQAEMIREDDEEDSLMGMS